MTPRAFRVLVALLFAALLACPASRADEPVKDTAKLLVVTGVEYHKWQETTPVIKRMLERDDRFQVDVFQDIMKLGDLDLSGYDAVVMHFQSNDEGVPGRAALDNMRRFVKSGGGLVLVHFACGAFQEFPDDFEQLAGRIWMGPTVPEGRHQHDPHGEYTVEITDVDHPITRGLDDFKTVDELYTCLIGDAPVTVLATARSKDGKDYPQAFVLEFGRGRVFHCTLGHDPRAFEAANARALYQRGAAWVAGLKP